METRLASLTLLLLTISIEAAAQGSEKTRVLFGADLDLANRYVWRGITRTNGPVLQPQLHAGVLHRGHGVSAGIWMNGELGNSSLSQASDFRPGINGIGEINYWLQYSHSTHGFDWAVGGIHYDFNARMTGTRLPRRNTSELYSRVQLSRVYAAPAVSAWYDIDQVKGAFLEGSATIPLFANPLRLPFAAVYLGLTGGASLGQDRESDTTVAYNFVRNGFIFADLALGLRIKAPIFLGAMRARIEAHKQFSREYLARHVWRERQDRPHADRFWISLQLGWGWTGGASDIWP